MSIIVYQDVATPIVPTPDEVKMLTMFARGEQGAWYDPNYLSSLYQDAAGTLPVTASGQPVGLVMDRSGNGNNATQATTTARPVLGDNRLVFDRVDDQLLYPMMLDGTAYYIARAVGGHVKTEEIPVFRQPDQPQITGVRRNFVHGFQPNRLAFPSTDLTNAAFNKNNTTASPAGVTPNGQPAFKVQVDGEASPYAAFVAAGYNTHGIRTEFATSVLLKAGTYEYARLGLSQAANAAGSVTVNLLTGELDPRPSAAVTPTITNEGDGWWRVTLSYSNPANTYPLYHWIVALTNYAGGADAGYVHTHDPSDYIYVAEPQFEYTPYPTSYQAIRSATDYDDSGLPVGSIWHKTDANDQVIQTLRYNGATWVNAGSGSGVILSVRDDFSTLVTLDRPFTAADAEVIRTYASQRGNS